MNPARNTTRATAEFLAVLLIGILFTRAFVAEAYIVPTGSMAPTLLGLHRTYACPGCHLRFVLGMDESGRSGRPFCPNCGEDQIDRASGDECDGDRLLVQKHLYDFRPPRRWEVVVFQNPAEGGQAYVKRVVGRPGEAIEIRGGDLYINGEIARKTLAEQRAMRLPIYDHDFPPADADRFPRWVFHTGGNGSRASPWKAKGSEFVHDGPTGSDSDDWLVYRHWQADRKTYGPVRDYTSYNGADLPGESRVDDLFLEAEVEAIDAVLTVRLGGGGDVFLIDVPLGDRIRGVPPRVRHNGQPIEVTGVRRGLRRSSGLLEASWFDRRLTVALGGELLFDPVDIAEPPASRPRVPVAPALAVSGMTGATVRHLRVFRDVYYTDALAHAPRRPFGVGEPYRLGAGEYFVLGDNSPVSNDSRFWPDSPVVTADRLVGKPFLVHLPSRTVPLRVFGRELYWVPDPREIRYIR